MVLMLKFCAGLSLLSAVLLMCRYYWKHRKILALARNLPSIAPTIPLLGNTYLIIHGLLGMSNMILKLMMKMTARGIGSFVIWLGPYPLIMIATPEDIQTVLNSEKALDVGPELNFVKYALGNGLVSAPASIWKITRRHHNPIYKLGNVELLVPTLNASGRILTASLSQYVNRTEVDILENVATVVLKSSVDLALGPELRVNVQSESFRRIKRIIPRITQLSVMRLVKLWLWPEQIFQFLYRKELKEIDNSLDSFLKESFQVLKISNSKKIGDAPGEEIGRNTKPGAEIQDSCKTTTLLDTHKILKENYPGFTDKDLKYEIATLLTAGANSAKAALCSCLLALAANPQIQDRALAEIVPVVGIEDSDVTMEDIKAMPYLDQVLNETLRKFMVIPLLTRSVKGDIKLKGFTVPAGATVCVTLAGLHYDPKHYPEPSKFDPNRFSPENMAKRERYSYLPFGGGPRNCIGKIFALTEIKILLVHVLRKFKLTTSVDINDLTFIPSISLLSADGYKIKLNHRY